MSDATYLAAAYLATGALLAGYAAHLHGQLRDTKRRRRGRAR